MTEGAQKLKTLNRNLTFTPSTGVTELGHREEITDVHVYDRNKQPSMQKQHKKDVNFNLPDKPSRLKSKRKRNCRITGMK
jgi:hypothetical protein